MENVGAFLRELRVQKNMSIEELSSITKVKTYIIEYIENNQFDQLENIGVARIYINTISKALDASSVQINSILAFIDKKYENKKDETLEPVKHVTPRKIMLSSNFFYSIFLVAVLIAFTWIIVYFYDSGKLTFNKLKNELFIAETKSTKTPATENTPTSSDSIWAKQNRVLNAKASVDHQSANVISNVKVIYDTTDYVDELIFEKKKSALNPEI